MSCLVKDGGRNYRHPGHSLSACLSPCEPSNYYLPNIRLWNVRFPLSFTSPHPLPRPSVRVVANMYFPTTTNLAAPTSRRKWLFVMLLVPDDNDDDPSESHRLTEWNRKWDSIEPKTLCSASGWVGGKVCGREFGQATNLWMRCRKPTRVLCAIK